MLQKLAVPISRRQQLLTFFSGSYCFCCFVCVCVWCLFVLFEGQVFIYLHISKWCAYFIFSVVGISYPFLTTEDYDIALFTHPHSPRVYLRVQFLLAQYLEVNIFWLRKYYPQLCLEVHFPSFMVPPNQLIIFLFFTA